MLNHAFLISLFFCMFVGGLIQVKLAKSDESEAFRFGYAVAAFFALLAVIAHTIWGPR
jgi:hypothetical protein